MMFGVETAALQLLMVGRLAALVGGLLFVITVIEFPFQGGIAVAPTSMTRVLLDLSGRSASSSRRPGRGMIRSDHEGSLSARIPVLGLRRFVTDAELSVTLASGIDLSEFPANSAWSSHPSSS